ncbi:hypothetical protein [Streptomyces sp. NPDC006879]|uniref:hypothetical protein n=1 Tax=Streptomyces sp. NPDC006879 TaxID=3364767 RepID=UPI003690D770
MSSLDRDTLTEIAERCLTRPSDALFFDDRLFTTHGAMFSWAELGDDILEESNYLSALSLIEGAAGDFADTHVIDGTSRHFACGSLRTIYVQVYETYEEECECAPTWQHEDECERDEDSWYCQSFCLNECDGEQCLPDEREFTPAFIEAAELAYGLLDYPIIDESDYSERESERFWKNIQEAIDDAHRGHWEDSDADREAILERAAEELNELYGHEANAGVSWSRVAEIWNEHRDAYFTERGNEAWNAPLPGQLLLIAA